MTNGSLPTAGDTSFEGEAAGAYGPFTQQHAGKNSSDKRTSPIAATIAARVVDMFTDGLGIQYKCLIGNPWSVERGTG
jgi:hypothetical protein